MRLININGLWKEANFFANKHQTGAQISPDEFNDACPVEAYNLVDIYYGNKKEYRPGSPVPAVAFEATQLVKDYISLYLKNEKPVAQDANGFIIPPDDHLHFSAASSFYYLQGEDEELQDLDVCTCGQIPCNCHDRCEDNGIIINAIASRIKKPKKAVKVTVPITVVNDAQWNELASHPIRKPDMDHNYLRFLENLVQVMPVSQNKINYAYLRYPKRPFWNHDDVINPGIATYVAAGSQDVELPEILLKELALCICESLGINVRESLLVELTERLRRSGL